MLPRRTTLPSARRRASHTGRKKLIFSSIVVKDSSGASVLANARDARLRLHWSLRGNSHFCFEIVVEMGLDGAQRLLSSFKAVEHDCTLEGRNDEGGDLLRVDPWTDFPRFDSGTHYRNNVAAPTT